MTKEQCHCFECKKELQDIEVSYVRLHKLINHSYDLKTENDKMKKFISNMSRITDRSARVAEQVVEEARELLREIKAEDLK